LIIKPQKCKRWIQKTTLPRVHIREHPLHYQKNGESVSTSEVKDDAHLEPHSHSWSHGQISTLSILKDDKISPYKRKIPIGADFKQTQFRGFLLVNRIILKVNMHNISMLIYISSSKLPSKWNKDDIVDQRRATLAYDRVWFLSIGKKNTAFLWLQWNLHQNLQHLSHSAHD